MKNRVGECVGRWATPSCPLTLYLFCRSRFIPQCPLRHSHSGPFTNPTHANQLLHVGCLPHTSFQWPPIHRSGRWTKMGSKVRIFAWAHWNFTYPCIWICSTCTDPPKTPARSLCSLCRYRQAAGRMGTGGFLPATGIIWATGPSDQKATRKTTSQTDPWTFCIHKRWSNTSSSFRNSRRRERRHRGACNSIRRGIWYAPAQAVDRAEEFRYGYVWCVENHALVSFLQVFAFVTANLIYTSPTPHPFRYFSPYPLTETEVAEGEDLTASSSNQSLTKIPGVVRATPRSHGRTSDLLAGGLQRHNAGESLLWVCHFCFKYMAEGGPWELHKVCYRSLSLRFISWHWHSITEGLQDETPTWKESLPTRRSHHLGGRWSKRKSKL